MNPRSVGLPRAGLGAQYAIWNDGEITLRSVPYDVPAVVEQIRDLRLPEQVFAPLVAVLEGRAPNADAAADATAP